MVVLQCHGHKLDGVQCFVNCGIIRNRYTFKFVIHDGDLHTHLKDLDIGA